MRPAAASATLHPLDYLLGTPALVRVTRVLATHGGGLALADVARRARLALPSTREAVRRLTEAGLVVLVDVGRSSLCTLRGEHPMAAPLAALFAAERAQFDGLLGALRAAAAGLAEPPVALWLYGSVARREDGPTSDLDLAAVLATPGPERADRLRGARAAAAPAHAARLSVITLAVPDIARLAAEGEQGAPFWRELARDAVVLFGDAPADLLARAGVSHPAVPPAGARP